MAHCVWSLTRGIFWWYLHEVCHFWVRWFEWKCPSPMSLGGWAWGLQTKVPFGGQIRRGSTLRKSISEGKLWGFEAAHHFQPPLSIPAVRDWAPWFLYHDCHWLIRFPATTDSYRPGTIKAQINSPLRCLARGPFITAAEKLLLQVPSSKYVIMRKANIIKSPKIGKLKMIMGQTFQAKGHSNLYF